MKSLNVLDLFSGAGGLSLGFQRAGFNIVGGVDFDRNAISTYKKNFPSARSWLEDLTSTTDDFKSWMESLKGTIDVVVGGPPCQGFSIAGKRVADDPRNLLYLRYLDSVEQLAPKYVVIENVPNITAMNGGAAKREITQDLKNLGYQVNVETLNASFYGVPQARRRTFFIGIRDGEIFQFPEQTSADELISCEEALSDLPSLDSSETGIEGSYASPPKNNFQTDMRGGSIKVLNHELVRHTMQTKSIISLVPDGGNYKNLPLELQGTRRVNIAWTRMNSRKPSFTIDAGHNHHFHYRENRVPSVRECARIQSFPDNFEFIGTRTSQYRQVGNAVPPVLAEKIALQIKRDLTGDR